MYVYSCVCVCVSPDPFGLVQFFGFYLKVSQAKKGQSLDFSPPLPRSFISTSVFGVFLHLSCRFSVEELQPGRVNELLGHEQCDLR